MTSASCLGVERAAALLLGQVEVAVASAAASDRSADESAHRRDGSAGSRTTVVRTQIIQTDCASAMMTRPSVPCPWGSSPTPIDCRSVDAVVDRTS